MSPIRFQPLRFFMILLLSSMLIVSQPNRSAAGPYFEDYNRMQAPITLFIFLYLVSFLAFQSDEAEATKTPVVTQTYGTSNFGATLERGENRLGGLISKTIWATYTAQRTGRIVVNTFGSEFDTVLAAYRAKPKDGAIRTLKLLKSNDNTPIPGYSALTSQVILDVVKGATYRFQIGGRKGAQGDVALTVTGLPPGGGVSAFLIDVGGNSLYRNRPYGCTSLPCQPATFVLTNGSTKTVTVTPTVSPSGLFVAPSAVTMKPGAVAVVTFSGKAGSVPSGGRAAPITFRFASKSGAAAVPSATASGYLALSDPAGTTVGLQFDVEKRLAIGHVNEPLPFVLRVRNTGKDTARGCHVRAITAPTSAPYGTVDFVKVSSKDKPLAAINAPVDIPPGQSARLKIVVRSQDSAWADLEFGINNEFNVACLNRQSPATDLLNTFDITAAGTDLFTNVTLSRKPNRTVLDVPRGKTASFDISAFNKGRELQLYVSGKYLYPSSEYDPDAQYAVTVCQLKAGKCVSPASFATTWTPKKGQSASFRVFVKAPKKNPGFDPKRFRVIVNVTGSDNRRPNVFGSTDVAVRMK